MTHAFTWGRDALVALSLTVVPFFTPKWDVGPGEHGDFPAKWMSANGRTLHLVFSGDDTFSVRQAMLVVR
ncbi:MAG: hypothetical protein Q7R41_17750 [Phycisphaerales bacterium]|nr:hypothetical protein [Phycisphaerales bacterium]